MPEIDSSLLTLMGISSGTYAVLKANENNTVVTTPPVSPVTPVSPATLVTTATPASPAPVPAATEYMRKDEDDNATGKDDNTEISAVG